ncbi:hypothetical protein M2139_000460 [Enterococcus sp. PF1-24]|uniref:hypothetical protein n=1 Tax=unclassified Enterococcus TaxID=2608891 RepID=UPI002473F3C5|nr:MULTISPECIES: hypothetical protein [unclassified Enterococcus]MDH6363485.1 hypothetical protein [Enterococcus sp. PFB1-1]MDH6400579.1 hypothetical protein [Enterococcus sp. PF1-24]
MKTSFTQTNQYSEATARKYIATDRPTQCTTSFIETQYEYVEKQRTENIRGYKLWFVQEGLNPFSVKFEKEPVLPPFLSLVAFDNLQGIEIRNNVYFKADGLKVVK